MFEIYPPEKRKLEAVMEIPVKKKPVRDSKKAVVAAEERRKVRNYRQQEAKRAPKLQIDQRIVLWSWLSGMGIAFIAAAIISFNGITSVALFIGLDQAWKSTLLFFVVEWLYLLFLVSYLVLSSRVDQFGNKEKVRGVLGGMIFFGGTAVLANAFHTLDFWGWAWDEPRMYAGVILSISAPLAIILSVETISRVVFAKAVKV
jgi:hypothetical protein